MLICLFGAIASILPDDKFQEQFELLEIVNEIKIIKASVWCKVKGFHVSDEGSKNKHLEHLRAKTTECGHHWLSKLFIPSSCLS